jgi:hypothetical protein
METCTPICKHLRPQVHIRPNNIVPPGRLIYRIAVIQARGRILRHVGGYLTASMSSISAEAMVAHELIPSSMSLSHGDCAAMTID